MRMDGGREGGVMGKSWWEEGTILPVPEQARPLSSGMETEDLDLHQTSIFGLWPTRIFCMILQKLSDPCW